jgi:hypothetical protein
MNAMGKKGVSVDFVPSKSEFSQCDGYVKMLLGMRPALFVHQF